MASYSERSKLAKNPAAKRLFALMDEKQTNLCLAADVTKKQALLDLVSETGSEICLLKTHIDIVDDFDWDVIAQLQALSKKHDFLIFEDRKFADIGNTVVHQYQGGIYRISDWADITNAHAVPGPGIVLGLRQIGLLKKRGLLLIAEMSSKGTLASGDYQKETIRMAKEYPDFVIGFIATKKLEDDPSVITMTPGVQLAEGVDGLGQEYLTPKKVIQENKSDIIIVGRGIYEANDPLAAARAYRVAGWSAYQERHI